MDKYEELKDYISSKILECQNELEKIKSEITITDTKNTEALRVVATRFLDYSNQLAYAKKKEILLKKKEQEVRTMLEDFCNNDSHVFFSFVYHVIVRESSMYKEPVYRVGDKYFKTLEEAKEYSISLGEKGDWLEDAYIFL